jgi:hypothetical protein
LSGGSILTTGGAIELVVLAVERCFCCEVMVWCGAINLAVLWLERRYVNKIAL